MHDFLRLESPVNPTGEDAANHVANALVVLAKVRREIREPEGVIAEHVTDLDAVDRRLRLALDDLRNQRITVQPISEDPYGPDLRVVTPQPVPIVFGEEQDD